MIVTTLLLTDVNECESNSTCHERAECYDNEGSYSCECRTGYEGDGYNDCIGELVLFYRHIIST